MYIYIIRIIILVVFALCSMLLIRDFLSREEADLAYAKCFEEMPFELYHNTREDTGRAIHIRVK